MFLNRLSRATPLTGVVFAVLAAAAFATAPGAPSSNASGGRVITFYEAHGSSAQTSDSLWMLAFAFLLFFAGSFRTFLRRTPTVEGLSSLVLAGAAVLAAGTGVYFGFDYTLATTSSHVAPAAAQALNVLALKLFFPVSAGGFVFGIGSGLAILRGAPLPNWLGWVAVVIGILTVSPAGLAGLVALIFWTAIVSVLVWRRTERDSEPLPVAAPA